VVNKFSEEDLKDLFTVLSKGWDSDVKTTNWVYNLIWLFLEGDFIEYPGEQVKFNAEHVLQVYKVVSSDALYKRLSAVNSEKPSFWMSYVGEFRWVLFEVPLDQLPLHINNPFEHCRITVAWRIKRGV
jgi:hypothetical protein